METKLPTIKEIAQRLNISPSTVSRALHDHPSIGLRTKMRVQKLAEELHYEPNQTAIFFKQRKTFIIGVVLPTLTENFFSRAISGIEDTAIQHHYNVLFGQSHDEVEREKRIVTAMKNQRVDGVIASLSKHTKNIDHFLALNNIPVVFFDRVPDLPNVHRVSFDMMRGTQEVLEFLFAQGHRRIGVLNGPHEMRSSKQRTDMYQQMLQKKRLKIDLSIVVSTDLTKEGTQSHAGTAQPQAQAHSHFNHQRLGGARRYSVCKINRLPNQ
ncbi:MAG: LacI family DNA-binding transcriptional regulator [Chitinophagaceae bacterium]